MLLMASRYAMWLQGELGWESLAEHRVDGAELAGGALVEGVAVHMLAVIVDQVPEVAPRRLQGSRAALLLDFLTLKKR